MALAHRDADAAIRWGERAIELATHCGDHEVAGMTHSAVGSAWLILEYDRGREYLERFLADTRERGEARHAANALAHLGKRSAETYHLEHAAHDLAEGLTFTDGRDLDMYQLFMRAWQALTLLHQGRWCESATVARAVLLRCGMSAVNRLPALVAFGRLYARAGLAEAHDALRDAREIAEPIGTSETFGLVSAACAEAAWLAGDDGRTLAEAQGAYEVAIRERHPWVAGELAFWRWKAGDRLPTLDGLSTPRSTASYASYEHPPMLKASPHRLRSTRLSASSMPPSHTSGAHRRPRRLNLTHPERFTALKAG
ncbi:MAG: hypothetical protein JOZ81_32015 [Chloroflexi bacterium]|nr:hypothetical protein [Chloroflexota bacterium]